MSYIHFKHAGEVFAKWFLAVTLSCSFAIGLHAQVSSDGPGKSGEHPFSKLDSGVPQVVVVVYDDSSIEAESTRMQSEQDLSSRHQRILEHKAGRYAGHKHAILAGMSMGEVELVKDFSHLPSNLVRIHSRQALERLMAQPGVAGVYENRIEQKLLAESLPLVGQPQVAAQGNLGAGTAVAVLDTGVDYTRSAFGSCSAPGVPSTCKVVFAQDFAPNDGQLDADGHGTNVAAIVAGVAPGTKIIALDVFGGGGTASSSDILSAINWVIANQATYNIVAMNLSLGSGQFTAAVTSGIYNTAVAQAKAVGVLTVAAAGNDGYINALSQPAAVAGVISVGAVYDSNMGGFSWGVPLRCTDSLSAADKVTCFSNSASFLTMLAPGSQILAGGITEGGTSQAAPHVAGAVAVLRSAFPAESLDQTVTRLTNGKLVTDSRNDIAKPRLYLPLALGVTATTCTYALSETSHSFDSLGSNASVAVTAGVGCSWNAASNVNDASWISVTSGGSGSGNGVVNYVISANPNMVGRTGSISVAGATFIVSQSGSVGAVANRLINPGFEDGAVAWSQSTANGYPVITALVNPPDVANSWYAWFCGYNNCTDTLYQDVLVPADAQSAYVQFSYWIKTTETAVISVYDSMSIRVSSTTSAIPDRVWFLSNLNATTGWVRSQPYDVSAFKGQTVRLQFSATTDASFATDFFVDDVNLMVSGSVPDTLAPNVPTLLSAVPISTSAISLTWAAASDNVGVTLYKLFRDGALLASKSGTTGYTDAGLLAGVSHVYAVAACDAAGNCSVPSQTVTAATPSAFSDTQAPTVPAGLNGVGTSVSSLNLAWGAATDNVGVTQYKVFRNGALLLALGNVRTYADSGLAPSTAYSYTVSACDAAGNCSAQSLAVSVSTLSPFSSSTPLIIEGAISVNWSANTANISIEKITNRSAYMTSGSLRIELWAFATPFTGSESGYKTASIRTVSITGAADQLTPYQSFTGLTMALPYAAPPAGNTNLVIFLTEYSTSCSQADKFCYTYYVNLHETQSPTVPSALSAIAASSSQVDLAWTASTDNVGVATYKVFRNSGLIAILGNVTSYSDIGLAASTTYSYSVAACDAVGNCSAQSVGSTAMTLAAPDIQPPSVPTGLTAVALSSSQVKLAWTASTDNVGVASYQVFTGGSLVDTLGNVSSATRVTVPLTTYRYTVAACDAVGNCSAQSAVASVTTPAQADTQPPSVPAGLTATPMNASVINLAWVAATDNFGVASYKVYRGGALLTTLGNVTSHADTGLRALTAYSYTVEACDASSNCSGQSAAATATTAGAATISQEFTGGWNLAGNSTDAPISVTTTFANTNDFLTVWKWNSLQGIWSFYAPTLAAQGGTSLADYVASKGYQEMTQITGGEGFWVNARQISSVVVPGGNVIGLTSIGVTLVKGWNLVSLGQAVTPKQFCDAQSSGITTLWAWDNLLGKWYFYAPNLEASGGSALSDYISAKGYLDFSATGKLLGPGLGFWVNKP